MTATPALAYLVRHAKAEPHGAAPEPIRALTPDGRARFAALAASLSGKLRVTRIVTSPYARARQTADLLAAATGAPVREDPALVSGASSGAEVLELLRRCGPGTALVGHDPELSEALARAGGEGSMRKGAVAAIDLSSGFRVAWMEAPARGR